MSPFSIPGWNISEIKNPNGTREYIGYKQKNISKKSKPFFKTLLRILIFLPLLTFTVLFITNKQTYIKNYISTIANNINSSNKNTTITTENINIVNKEVLTVNKTVTEEKHINTQTRDTVEYKSKQPVIVPVVIKDYSASKPWEAFNIIKAELKTTDNQKVLKSLFDYLSSFKIDSTTNQGLAAVWKNKCASDKTIAELFSYIVNSGSNLKCYTVKTKTGKYWNVVNISGTTIIYDISNKIVTKDKDNPDYQNGYKY